MCVTRMNGRRDISGEPGIFPITLSSSTLKNWMTHHPRACCVPAVNAVRFPVPSFKDMVLRSCSTWRVVWMPGQKRDLRWYSEISSIPTSTSSQPGYLLYPLNYLEGSEKWHILTTTRTTVLMLRVLYEDEGSLK